MYLDWSTNDRPYYSIDIETDSLNPTKIWVMCWQNIKNLEEKGTCTTYEQMREFFKQTTGSYYVGHNILKFDAPHLNRLAGTRLSVGNCIDTLVLGTLYRPSIDGGHSLDAWGARIGEFKTEFSDWTKLSPEMIEYCSQDALVAAKLYRKLTQVLNKVGFSEQSCEIQHRFMAILEQQRKNGFRFDGPRALAFYQQLRQREHELGEEIRTVFPPVRQLVRDSDTRTKSGATRAQYEKDMARYFISLYDDGRKYRAFEDIPFNIGSPKQRVEKLTALGWEADEYTPKGFPKVTEKSLISFVEQTGIEQAALITKWMAINGRANMVNTWLENWNEQTECIHGNLYVADTLRLRHQSPNTANIPAVRFDKQDSVLKGESGYYTYEARDLWCARPGRTLVGTDASGLELRMLAHFLNRPAFTKTVLDGDPHQYNADLAGVDRPTAKTILYAIQYGAQDAKVASLIKGTRKEGKELREKFLDRLGLTGVMNDAISEQKRGRIRLVDGSMVVCPSQHAALNYRLQGSGARVMAQASIFLAKHIRYHGLDSLKVGDIHDEWQFDVEPRDAREHARLSVQSIREAGEELNLNIPLDGAAKEGLTWAQTH